MPKYIITEDTATWLRSYYEVEAESVEEAEEALNNGDIEYLGFDMLDNVDFIDRQLVSIEESDARPFCTYPSVQAIADAKAGGTAQ